MKRMILPAIDRELKKRRLFGLPTDMLFSSPLFLLLLLLFISIF